VPGLCISRGGKPPGTPREDVAAHHTPASPIAQVIVILEAVTGVFYLAVVVASLIGTFFGQRPDES
jgi:hypothetical protein